MSSVNNTIENTIFHKIIRREIPAEFVFEDELVIVIKDINPVTPVHLLVIPKQTIKSVAQVEDDDLQLLGHMLLVAKDIAAKQSLNGYRLVINTGESAGQTVPQLHLHILGGRSMGWPPG